LVEVLGEVFEHERTMVRRGPEVTVFFAVGPFRRREPPGGASASLPPPRPRRVTSPTPENFLSRGGPYRWNKSGALRPLDFASNRSKALFAAALSFRSAARSTGRSGALRRRGLIRGPLRSVPGEQGPRGRWSPH
jgi:hypothetical protein